jgi:hypothetical protein
MQTITIASTPIHEGPGLSAIALLALTVVVVGIVGWQLFVRSRSFRGR